MLSDSNNADGSSRCVTTDGESQSDYKREKFIWHQAHHVKNAATAVDEEAVSDVHRVHTALLPTDSARWITQNTKLVAADTSSRLVTQSDEFLGETDEEDHTNTRNQDVTLRNYPKNS